VHRLLRIPIIRRAAWRFRKSSCSYAENDCDYVTIFVHILVIVPLRCYGRTQNALLAFFK
jgi:hypothetical protein